MTIRIPTVSEHMTPSPHSIGDEQTLATAKEWMHKYGVRHLPVLHGGTLVGVLSERDITLVESLETVDPHRVRVEETMTEEVFVVAPDTPLDAVASDMAKRRLGSVLVVDEGHVVGIFTTVDACRALVTLLRPHAP